MSRRFLRLAAVVISVAAGCRPDPGASDYVNHTFAPADMATGTSLSGPAPFTPGQKRLSLGIFYEGGYSDIVLIDNAQVNFYIYDNTVTIKDDTADYVEGVKSNVIANNGARKGYVGSGLDWMTPRDLTVWKKLYVSLKSSDPSLSEIKLEMSSAGMAKAAEALASAYGYKNDGQWHNLVIPVADLIAGGVDITMVKGPFIMIGADGAAGESYKIDDLHLGP